MNATGKRYVCESCGSQMLVTRGGDGRLVCCGAPMTIPGSSTTGHGTSPDSKQDGGGS